MAKISGLRTILNTRQVRPDLAQGIPAGRPFMRRLILSIILTSLFSLSAHAQDEELVLENVLKLKPTQAFVGMKSIKVKTKMFEDISRSERHEYLQQNPVPVIKGPNQEFYMIDHHHLSRSLYESDHRKIYVQVVRDWSDLSIADFWQKMDKAGFAYLLDTKGNRITPAELPSSITDLKNDTFRSLAYFARKQGAYEKSVIPFAEFKWAAYYRTHFSEEDLEKDWHGTLKKAIDLSFIQEAAHLPGYKGEFSCERIF